MDDKRSATESATGAAVGGMAPGSKAVTLERLRAVYPDLNIPELIYFTLARWRREPEAVLAEIRAAFVGRLLVVRSSARAEDTAECSNAGAFLSLLDVDSGNEVKLREAVEAVARALPGESGDQVLVQPMVEDVRVSGVIMTRCIEDGSPYIVINYDESGKTDRVTGGQGASKTVHVFRGAGGDMFRSPRLKSLVALAGRLEGIFGSSSLDIEFGIDGQERVHLFQVRPIAARRLWSEEMDRRIVRRMGYLESFVQRCMLPRPGLFGESSVLGVMPDWNPAEMIGVTPRPLAASLYRELITSSEWRKAREVMGYKPLPAEELMVLVAGRPYIDVRVSFNSFLPSGMAPHLAAPLVDAWLHRLCTNPELHDKIEFSIASTCYDFSFDATFARRYPGLFTADELSVYKGLLMGLTRRCLDLSPAGTLALCEASVAKLERRQAMRPSLEGTGSGVLPAIKTLAEECRVLGTRPFSVLARHAFIAESLLRSAVERGALRAERLTELRRSIRTVGGDISCDFQKVLAGEMPRDVFLSRYGHLRPGSYDILSPRYAARRNLFDASAVQAVAHRPAEFALTPQERRSLNALLSESALADYEAEDLLQYVRRAIAGREQGKFVFTRNLSDILEGLVQWGRNLGLSPDDVSFLPFNAVMEQLISGILTDEKSHFSILVAANRERFKYGQALRLPFVITSPRDVYVVPQHRSAPNFISQKRTFSPVVNLSSHDEDADLTGKVVCIENADPGFDWIFTRGIAGLVTKFGGANSHMAVRCAEYGLPAAIGCGEKLFAAVSEAGQVDLDAGALSLRPVSGGHECV
ncbi:PEP-utilizing enzyme [Desulfocurvus sp. DL9XJH121]